jgi:hypothetical protein
MTLEPSLSTSTPLVVDDEEGGPETFEPSELEREVFQIIRAILRPVVKPGRIAIRDAASYCAIFFDDNNRKPICRLRFNNESRLVVRLFNEKKEEERIPLESLDQLFDFSDRLKECVTFYLKSIPIRELDTNSAMD